MRLVIGATADMDRSRLGRDGIAAASRDLQLRLMDRHGMAWSDLDGNGEPDAYVNNGGYGGELAALRARHPGIDYNNELFCQTDGRFSPCIAGTGLFKDAGRGRRVAWVDFDGNGRLDLYLDNRDTPNRLFRQRRDGTFVDRAHGKGVVARDQPDLPVFAQGVAGNAEHLLQYGAGYVYADIFAQQQRISIGIFRLQGQWILDFNQHARHASLSLIHI